MTVSFQTTEKLFWKVLLLCLKHDILYSQSSSQKCIPFLSEMILRRDTRAAVLLKRFEVQNSGDSSFLESLHDLISKLPRVTVFSKSTAVRWSHMPYIARSNPSLVSTSQWTRHRASTMSCFSTLRWRWGRPFPKLKGTPNAWQMRRYALGLQRRLAVYFVRRST